MKYLPKKSEYNHFWVIDIETDGLWPTLIWCMCVQNAGTGEALTLIGHEAIKTWFSKRESSEYFVAHNGLSYDFYHLDRLLGTDLMVDRGLIDSLVLSYLYNPGLPGGHSLAAWGERFKEPKGDFKEFDKFSDEMARYCEQDVRITCRVFRAVVERMLHMGFSELSCQIEHDIRVVLDEQQRAGWSFDIPGAQSLLSKIRAEQADLEEDIRRLFPEQLTLVGTYEYRTTKFGEPYASYTRHLEKYPKVERNKDGTYSTFEWTAFNIGSPKQRIERLVGAGYKPINFTPTGQPKVDEESLLAFAEESGKSEVKAIAEWLVLQGRATMLETWLNNVNYEDGRMHGRVFTCGASTRRMTHNSPNTANIPKAKRKIKYGIECRQIWRATPGRCQVGADASGLEMRMFAEYLKNDEATRLFIEGDPHLNNTRNLGLEDHYRDLTVKNAFYAYLYGAQDPKLGSTLRPELAGRAARDEGARARAILEGGTPGLARLVSEIGDEFKRTGGVLSTIDGGFVRCPSPHAALNYKLQSAGAIVMKVAAILARNEVRRLNLDAFEVGNIHDELQYDCHPDCAEQVGKLLVQSIVDAGVYLGMSVPLDGAYKVGSNWAETH